MTTEPIQTVNPKSIIVFENQHYEACVMRDGALIVMHKHKQHGRQGVRVTSPEADKWIDAITTSMDKDEAREICRVILNQ